MSETTETPNWRSKANFWIWAIIMLAIPAIAHAGGLGMAPLAAIIAGIGYLTFPGKTRFSRIPPWIWALFAFLAWAWITALWSPYQNDNTLSTPLKVILGLAIYLGTFLSVSQLGQQHQSRLQMLTVVAGGIIALLLIVDLVSGLAITDFFDPVKPDELPARKRIYSLMNLGHSSALLILLFPAIALILSAKGTYGQILAAIFGVLILFIGVKGGFNVAIIAIPMIAVAFGLAGYFPFRTIKTLFGLAISLILFAPLLGFAMRWMPESFRSQLPASWDHRVVMWDYVSSRIMEQQIIGHGFDAARTFDANFIGKDGYEMSVVSLHPHNFGLHIWVETGAVGVGLALFALALIGHSVIRFLKQSPNAAPAVAGLMVGIIICGTVSYGVWQEWLWASLILISALYFGLFKEKY